ncbi:uncharacterized protein LOC114718732 isoform X2 [Neltuma alba]|uniref:uncharacterized protein LOC114718732 isoform X2 n=1 Tax=Neltuma alba TaxID=207710 RepID=UPI0010A3FC0D|nr:uncharacterized protein LOC114718732 isoform X2 [Prosopis alba]
MLFKLKNSQGSARFAFQQALHLHHHHHHHYLLMAYMVGYDPSSNLTLSKYSSLSSGRGGSSGCNPSFPFLRKQLHVNAFPVKRCIGFTLQGCFDTSSNNNKLFVNPTARGFAAFPRPPLLADTEDATVQDNNRNAIINTSLNGSPTKPLNFRDCHLSRKIVVAVDVDEVLGNFVSALNRFIADQYSSNYSVSEYHVYEFFKIWNCSREEAAARVHEFFKTPYFKTGIHPLPGAQTALQKLSRFCNLSVVTSRQNAIKDHTIDWLEKNFPGLFQEIHFGNHFALDGVPRPKSEICSEQLPRDLVSPIPCSLYKLRSLSVSVIFADRDIPY